MLSDLQLFQEKQEIWIGDGYVCKTSQRVNVSD